MSGLTKIFIYILVGILFSLIILFAFIVPSGKVSATDILRLFLSPAIIGLIAASFGAWVGAKSNKKANQADLAETYMSLLDLMKEDIRINLRIMARVQDKIVTLASQKKIAAPGELAPESLHTMFFENIEFHKLRQLTPSAMITDIFNIRNMRYVFNQWNELVAKYYREEDAAQHTDGERGIVRHLTAESADENFIESCKRALNSIDMMQQSMFRSVLKSI